MKAVTHKVMANVALDDLWCHVLNGSTERVCAMGLQINEASTQPKPMNNHGEVFMHIAENCLNLGVSDRRGSSLSAGC